MHKDWSRIGQVGSRMGQVGSRMGQVGSRIGQVWSRIGQVGSRIGQVWSTPQRWVFANAWTLLVKGYVCLCFYLFKLHIKLTYCSPQNRTPMDMVINQKPLPGPSGLEAGIDSQCTQWPDLFTAMPASHVFLLKILPWGCLALIQKVPSQKGQTYMPKTDLPAPQCKIYKSYIYNNE